MAWKWGSMPRRGTIALLLVFPMLSVDSRMVQAQSYHLVGAAEAYTLVNLHPDERSGKLSSVNYQQRGLIPLCTRVAIESVSSSGMKFRLATGGRQYSYEFHRTLREPVDKHLDRYFGRSCDKARIQRMSQADRDGILEGHVLPEMTKEGVILAIGYPPEHVTPNLEANAWRYWKNRWGDTLLVHFEGGKVTHVQD